MLNDEARVAQTAELVLGTNNVALCPFARLLQAFDSLAWVLRSCDTLVLGLRAWLANKLTLDYLT